MKLPITGSGFAVTDDDDDDNDDVVILLDRFIVFGTWPEVILNFLRLQLA